MWKVYAKGGARAAPWRMVFEGPEVPARRRYQEELDSLLRRPGGGHVLMVAPPGRPVCSQWRPPRSRGVARPRAHYAPA